MGEVIADEEEHEALATQRLRELIAAEPDGRVRATRPLRFAAFLRLGRPHELLWALTSGWARRLRAVGLNPVGLPALLPALLPAHRRRAA